ncbi:MarR family transcriptional regulator [Silicimonas algicola]|uniref:MarR family transcriptional regulator n=1 Tax=Silicimonas algicola TaxID=1826607 RepID=A0A316G747_9RHOB|nr:MarR family transcriptional regulator [Silicimonas algicola]AZQ69418.1 MarR family transcriptional regulator [Silicimonas algicola]PWK56483.1 MarR family transcriptional regulator [Silicimonas algicola]
MRDQTDSSDQLAIALFSEIFMADQLARARLAKVLPKGMELSHFSVLHHLARAGAERTPAQLARTFHVTRGAMTNTISRLEWAGYVHVRPDWDDARRKFVGISLSGVKARDAALEAIAPILTEVVRSIGPDRVRAALPTLRELRVRFETPDEETSSHSSPKDRGPTGSTTRTAD